MAGLAARKRDGLGSPRAGSAGAPGWAAPSLIPLDSMAAMRDPDRPRTHPELSVVLAALNGEANLPAQLEAISRQECGVEWEMIVVDNGSTDATVAVASSFRNRIPRLRVIEASERGKAHALNAGVAAASGALIVCVDHDDVVAPGYLEAMRRALTSSHLAAGRLEHRLLNPSWAIQKEDQTTSLIPLGPRGFSSGSALAFRRDVHEALGGFATDVGAFDDLDFCLRAQLADFTLTFVPGAVVHYRHRTRWTKQFRRGFRYGRGNALLHRKHGPDAAPWLGGLAELRRIASHAVHARDRRSRYQFAHLAGRIIGLYTVNAGRWGGRRQGGWGVPARDRSSAHARVVGERSADSKVSAIAPPAARAEPSRDRRRSGLS
jgi:glycosyltransferase involved in cell wall biosynthesis